MVVVFLFIGNLNLDVIYGIASHVSPHGQKKGFFTVVYENGRPTWDNIMTHLTIGETCLAVGKSAKTIYRHIASGKLSAVKNNDGQYRFDPVELQRVYGLVNVTPQLSKDGVTLGTPDNNKNSVAIDKLIIRLESEVDFLRKRVTELEGLLKNSQCQNLQLSLGHKSRKFNFWDFFRRKEPASEL